MTGSEDELRDLRPGGSGRTHHYDGPLDGSERARMENEDLFDRALPVIFL